MIEEIKYKDHEEWLAIRRKYIGGSDAASVVGMNPYRSRYQLWAEKSGKIKEFEGNLCTETGAYLEDFVAQLFERETGKKVRRKNVTLVNTYYPWACANIDRKVVGEDALLEIKTTTSVPIMRQLKGTEFPDAYYCQCVHYLAVTGKEKCYLAVLIQNRDFKIYELERDEAEINALMTAEAEFMDLVLYDTPPAVDGSISASEVISELYPVEKSDAEIDLMPFESSMQKYFELCDAIKTLEVNKRAIANEIKEYMKDSSRGASEHFQVSYSSSQRETFDFKQFRSDHPNFDVSKYLKSTTSRTLKITEINNKGA